MGKKKRKNSGPIPGNNNKTSRPNSSKPVSSSQPSPVMPDSLDPSQLCSNSSNTAAPQSGPVNICGICALVVSNTEKFTDIRKTRFTCGVCSSVFHAEWLDFDTSTLDHHHCRF